MTRFDTEFETAAAPDHLAEFGESVIYHPSGGAPRPITAIVKRDPPARLPEVPGGRGRAAKAEVTVMDDAILGITAAELAPMRDQVEYPVRIGETAESRTLGQLIEGGQVGGMITVEVK